MKLAQVPYHEQQRLRPVRWWHEAIIDDMLAFPLDTLAQRSARLNYSVSRLSILINSDLFKAMYVARRAAYSERLDGSITQKTMQVADKALDIMLETMEKKRSAIPFADLATFTDKTLQRLGYGTPKGPAVQVNVNQQTIAPPVSAEQLKDAREALRAAESAKLIEATVTEKPLVSESKLPSNESVDVDAPRIIPSDD